LAHGLFILGELCQQRSDALHYLVCSHRSLRVLSDAFRGTSRKDRALGFHLSNLIDDLGIGQRRDVAGILVVRNRSENAAHDLPGTGLWHIGDNHGTAWTSDRPYLTNHRVFHSLADVLAGGKPRLQRYVEVRDLAFDFVPGRNYRRLGGLLNKQAGGLDLLGPKPMPGDVDDIVDSTQDTIIAIGRPGATKRPVLLSTRYESNPLGLAISLLRASHRN
jgi:hypothetical protein